MELVNEFTVAAPIGEAWPLLIDIERIAPCVPGFQLTGAADGEYRGAMKIKVGAVQSSYDCVINFVEVDADAHRAVISARGKEMRGQGGVTAEIISTLTEKEAATHASVVTKLDVTGRVAQFGRGILSDVSDRLVKQFVARLEAEILGKEQVAETGSPAGPAAGGNGSGPGSPNASGTGGPASGHATSEPLDLLAVAGAPLVKRAMPLLALVAIWLIWFVTLRSRSGR